jgi:hypothetical protein
MSPQPHPYAAVEAVLAKMANVEEGLSCLWEGLSSINTNDQVPREWPPPLHYASSQTAIIALELAKNTLGISSKTLTFPSEALKKYLVDARDMSLMVSNTAYLTMRAIDAKLSENTTDTTWTEVAKILQHLTEATSTVWTTVDLLEQLYHSSLKSATTNPRCAIRRGMKEWLVLGCLVCCLLLTAMQKLQHPAVFTAHRTATVVGRPCVDMTQTFCRFQGLENQTACFQHSHNHRFDVLDQRVRHMEGVLEDNGIRIDNMWDALGPPNADGTYYSAEIRETCKGDEKLQGLKEGFEKRMEKVEANVLALKKAVRMADIRFSNRLNKIELKG